MLSLPSLSLRFFKHTQLLGSILETVSLKTYFYASKAIESTIIEGAIYAYLKKSLEFLKYETHEERIGRLIPYIMANFSFVAVTEL